MTGMVCSSRRTGRLLSLLAALSLILLLPTVSRAGADAAMESSVSRYLDSIRDDPVRLQAFLRDMPKGGDLHSHLSGAVSTESLIRFAVADGLCIDTASFVASFPPCTSTQRPAADATADENFYNQVIAAWSMEDFVPGPESGHDHFFNAFGKFDAASSKKGDMLAEVASRAAAQNEFYLETMLTRQSSAVRKLAQRFGFDPDFAQMLKRLKQDGAMDKIVEAAEADTDADLARFSVLLGCDGPRADPACTLPIRFLSQVNRTSAREVVFAQTVLGFELMERDKRYGGINFVAPEDNPVALADYRLHMQMVGFLRDRYQRDHVTLHAGELTDAFAPASELSFHIREAVEVAKADRIGHGVDIRQEEASAPGVLKAMAERHVLVEINLTSNCQILVVCAKDHPFVAYRSAGVPVALSTDDEGIERTDLTAEYQQAVRAFQLTYDDLKTLARTAIEHGFIEGDSLWREPDDFRPRDACASDRIGGPDPGKTCRQLLDSSPKAQTQWKQEAAFLTFERTYGG